MENLLYRRCGILPHQRNELASHVERRSVREGNVRGFSVRPVVLAFESRTEC